MTDFLTKAQRSERMRRITGDDLKPETLLRQALVREHAFFLCNVRSLPGKPDLLLQETDGYRRSVAVFVHGCFWHGCPRHYKAPKSRRAHWAAHLAKNQRRDRRVRRQLNRLGYRTKVVWEHQVRTPARASAVARRLLAFANTKET